MLNLLKKYIKLWGVKFETDLPPEFVISKHAEERLRNRVGVSKKKMSELVVKAWHTKDVQIPKLNKREYKAEHFYKYKRQKVCRELMGYIYVFAYSSGRAPFNSQKVLITVI